MTAARAKIAAQAAAVALVAALLALLVWKLAGEEASTLPEQIAAGEKPPAPAFDLPRLDGEGSISLADLRGKAVVINFWASWCVPCKEEAPVLERAWREHRDEGLVVLGVNFNDLRSDARTFLEDTGTTYPVVVDRGGGLAGEFGATGLPETYFVDREGRLVGARIAGAINARDEFERQFDEALSQALG